MIRIIDAHDVVSGREKYIEYAGTKDDTKPTDEYIATGSTFLEVDTGDVYFWNEENNTWEKAGGE